MPEWLRFLIGSDYHATRATNALRHALPGSVGRFTRQLTPDGGGGSGAGDTTAGGGGNDTVAGGAGDDDGDDDADGGRLSRDASRQIIESRDLAKATNRALLDSLGLTVEYETDATGKKKPVIGGLDRVKNALKALDDDADAKHRKTGNWDARKAELTTAHKTEVDTLARNHAATVKGRDALIGKLAVDGPLQSALLAAGCLPKAARDAAKLARENLRWAVADPDEAGGEPTVEITVVDDDGKPLTDTASGKPLALDAFARRFLADRPHLRDANFRAGPGANGNGRAGNGRAGNGTMSDTEAGVAAADALFGVHGTR